VTSAASGGIPDGARWTPVPDVLFSAHLPELGSPSAVGVILVVIWRVNRRPPKSPPAMNVADLQVDPVLHRYLKGLGVAEAAIGSEVDKAVTALLARGLLIEAWTAGEQEPQRWLFVNGPEGRRAYEAWQAGDEVLPDVDTPAAARAADRPTVFALYEDNFGIVTPMLAEELREAEQIYPESWIEDAMRLAVENNARRWSYVRAILERWVTEGRDDETDRRPAERGRTTSDDGPYAGYVRH
jgi:DnaD/phage-associated family protein